jgi:uncharacterized lipoprotein YajG
MGNPMKKLFALLIAVLLLASCTAVYKCRPTGPGEQVCEFERIEWGR